MPEYLNTSSNANPLPTVWHDSSLQAIQVVVDALMDLNIARKNMLIYPPSHEQVQRSVRRAWDRMQEAVTSNAPLKITVLQERLMAMSNPLDEKNAALKELAQILKQRGIAALTFLPEFGQAELVSLLQLITLDPEQFKSRRAIEMAALGGSLSKIHLHAVDYSKLHVTDEDEIQRGRKRSKEKTTWAVFVSHMMAGPLAAENKNGQSAQQGFDPRHIADLLNKDQVQSTQAIAYYQAMIAEYLEQGAQATVSPAALPTGLESFHQLVKDLRPELQQQFLSVAFDQCARHERPDDIQGLMGSMDETLVLNMLRHANTQGKQISPSLLAFAKKMGALNVKIGAGGHSLVPKTNSGAPMQSLLEREAYEDYVDETYDHLLKKFSNEIPVAQNLSDDLAVLKARIDISLEETHLTTVVASALKGLMIASMDVEEYRDWARQLTFMLDDLIIMGAFGSLTRILDSVQQEHRTQVDAERGKICALVLDHFNSQAFLATAVAAIHKPIDQIVPEALTFLERLGEPVIIEVIDFVGNQERIEPNSALLAWLRRSTDQAVRETLERLSDPRIRIVCRMLELLRILGRGEDIEGVRKLLDHEDEQVRMEALSTLLCFNNTWGIVHLRELLAGPWSPAAQQAMQLSAFYKVREIVPTLLLFVKRSRPVGLNVTRREAALRTLGKIGDPQAVGMLTKIARRRWSLSRKHLAQLKRVLFESLDGYDYDAIKDLLHMGLRQKDQMIVATCRQLLKKHHQMRASDDELT